MESVRGRGGGADRGPSGRGRRSYKSWFAGLISAPVLALALTGASVTFWPDWPAFQTLARVLDSLTLHMAAAAALGLGAMAWLGAPRAAVLLGAAAVAVALTLTGQRYLSVSQPLAPDLPADITVLWFNMLAENATDPETLAAALADSPADVVMVTEAVPLTGQIDRLAQAFPVRAGCDTEGRCDFLVLSRIPGMRIKLYPLGRLQERRMAVVRLARPGEPPWTLVGLHMVKPWFFGITESEEWKMMYVLHRISGPLVLMGDLNAAPWSRRVHLLARRCALATPRLPRPTWPAGAGWFGLPIDHVLVREARLTGLDRFGAGLGSNHLGLLARISLDGADPDRPVPAACTP